MKRFQKDKKYIREDYKAMRLLEQVQTFNNITLKLRVSTPSNTRKYMPRSIPRQVQQSILKSTLSLASRSQNQQNMNITFKSIVKKVKAGKSPFDTSSFYKQFLELQKETKNYICYYDNKHKHKFMQLLLKEGDKEPYVILLVFKDKFPDFTQSNLASRKLLALGVNPDDDFQHISWEQYSLLRRLMTQKPININEGVKYLMRFFVPNGENRIKKDEFVYLISSILRPHDTITPQQRGITLLDSVMKKVEKEDLLSREEISLKEMRELLGKQSLFGCNDFLYMLFQH